MFSLAENIAQLRDETGCLTFLMNSSNLWACFRSEAAFSNMGFFPHTVQQGACTEWVVFKFSGKDSQV